MSARKHVNRKGLIYYTNVYFQTDNEHRHYIVRSYNELWEYEKESYFFGGENLLIYCDRQGLPVMCSLSIYMQRTFKMVRCYKTKKRLRLSAEIQENRREISAKLRSFSLKFYCIFSAIWSPWRVHCLCVTYCKALTGPHHCSSVFCYVTAIIRLQVLVQVAVDFDWWQSWCHNRRLTGKSSWDRIAP